MVEYGLSLANRDATGDRDPLNAKVNEVGVAIRQARCNDLAIEVEDTAESGQAAIHLSLPLDM